MFTLNCNGTLLSLEKPIVMGILNITPDSFYEGSRMQSTDDLLKRAETMVKDGAAILDIGGQSSRPGSRRVSAEEELQRVLPAIEAVHQRFPEQVISIDTFYGKIAREAAARGASIINDISAGSMDEEMIPAVVELRLPYVLMHMAGDPQTMQEHPHYENVTLEVFDQLNFKLKSLREAGIKDIIIDPGFGFGKTAVHNFQLLKELDFFRQLECPIMVGLSRKATIYRTLGITAAEALNGTSIMNTIALMNGASILRVHDVKEAREAIALVCSL